MNPSIHKSDLSFKMTILYDSFPALVRARAMRNRLAEKFRGEMDIESHAWCFSLISHPHLCQQAATDAADSDMVVVSLKSSAVLSERVRDWAERWLPGKRGGRALAALLDKEEKRADELTLEYLEQTTEEHGLEFFSTWYPLREAAARNESPEIAPSALLARNIVPADFTCRGWGLNE